ncbi:MAG: leucine--tRNA ligase [Trueperaceae bacterium]
MAETSEAVPAARAAGRYNPQTIEPKWQARWQEQQLYTVNLESDVPRFYFLTMYPYPSGNLHVGHWYAEAPADAAARYRRMRGYNVLFPMGFDSFGLPAENAAIKAAKEGEEVHPAKLTYDRIEYMERQFRKMGAMIDWTRKVVTCDPEYYRWNQWFFIKMYERGLAYRKESYVNWDPVDQTVLANEQVIDGRGDRSGALVERRLMPQWHLKITDYAEELLDFSGLDWPERVRLMQTNWIGRSEGAQVTFKSEQDDPIEIFTTRPDTLHGATFMVLAPEHPLVAKLVTSERRQAVESYVARSEHTSEIDRQAEGREKTGEFIGAYATNPVNGKRIPIWIADYVLMTYGTGAIMAVPAHDQRDFEFARKFGLEIVPVIVPEGAELDGATMTEAYSGDGVMARSGRFDGTPAGKGGENEGITRVVAWLQEQGLGSRKITYRLRDWLISRQRYWGTPIPMIFCEACGLVAEREENLPVELPQDVAFMPTGESPLKHHQEFLNTHCPSCGEPATRETDTMDTFMDSSWYWFRYLSPSESDAPFNRERAKRWTPVDMYTGGIEHAILHLLYARFFTKVIRDIGLIDSGEPFLRLRNQGMILGEDNEKMSKSRGNVVDPDDLVESYGADSVRAYLMFIGPWDQGGPWNPKGIEGVTRFLNRVWSVVTEPAQKEPPQDGTAERDGQADTKANIKELRRAVHHAIKEVTIDFEAFSFNTAIAELMTLQNAMSRLKSSTLTTTPEWSEAVESLLLLLAPIAPHLSEELWEQSGHEGSVHLQEWPGHDDAALVADTVSIAVQVNGKVRAQITVPAESGRDELLSAARSEQNVARYLAQGELVREIVVPGRLVNLVIK